MKPRKVDADTVRAVYPKAGSSDVDYCVGGAFLRYIEYRSDTPFCYPSTEVIAAGLREANPVLTQKQASIRANWITRNNDSSRIDKAWATLDRALAYPDKPSK